MFTLPHQFNGLILYSERNQRALLGLLFDAVAETLLEFGHTELGGKVGFTLAEAGYHAPGRPGRKGQGDRPPARRAVG